MKPAPDIPTVTLIVVNYNGGDELQTALERFHTSLSALGSADLIVIDNASTDGSREVAARFCAQHDARAILNETNIGYAAAINGAASCVRSPILAFCNMDVLVDPEWLHPLVGWLTTHPACAAVNPLILLPDGEHVNAAGQRIHVTGLGFNRHLGALRTLIDLTPHEVSGLQGAAVLIRRDAFDTIGGIPSDGFLYHEDVHLSLRLRLAGFELWCIPSSVVVHDYQLSMYPEKFFLLERNRLATLLTCFRHSTLLMLTLPLLFTEAFAWIYSALRGQRFLAAKWRSYAWLATRRRDLRTAHRNAARSRRVSDREVMRHLHWGYEWRQFLTLARERGVRRRKSSVSGTYCM